MFFYSKFECLRWLYIDFYPYVTKMKIVIQLISSNDKTLIDNNFNFVEF